MTEAIGREWEIADEFSMPKNLELRELAGASVNPLVFDPPGPVGEAYVYGMEPIDYIMGPVGSGKTTCSIFRIPTFSLRMPICSDGVIRVRGMVVHENFRTLYRTGLESLFQFFPRDFPGATFEGGQDRPFKFTLRFMTPKGKKLQIVLDGFGIGDKSIEDLLRGYQANFAWNIEADLLARKVKTFQYGRVVQGRYPGRARLQNHDAKIPASVWGDLNPPLISHYIVDDFIDKPLGGHVLRRQPSGLSDQAENRKFVTRESYEQMANTLTPDEVRRFVHGEFGIVGDGALVYPSFDHGKHVAKAPLDALDLPLRIGFDAKGTPAMVITQFTPAGKKRVLDECIGEPNMSAGRFAENAVNLLQAKYRGLPILRAGGAWADPSGFYGADRQAGELSFMEIIARALNVQILPTQTNEPQARMEAVDWFLRHADDPNDPIPYFYLSPTCKQLLGGFMGGFLIKLNSAETSDRIGFVKNKFSHGHEALQYDCYGTRGHAGMLNDAARAGRPGMVVPIRGGIKVRSDFNV